MAKMLGNLDDRRAVIASCVIFELFKASGWKATNLVFYKENGNESLKRDAQNDENTIRHSAARLREIGFLPESVELLKSIAECASLHAATRRAYHEGFEDHNAVHLIQFHAYILEASQCALSPIAAALRDLAMHAAWHAANTRAYYEGGCCYLGHLHDADRDMCCMIENKMTILACINTEIALSPLRNELTLLRSEINVLREALTPLRNELTFLQSEVDVLREAETWVLAGS